MKTCLNCAFENPDDAHYCARCRFTLDWSASETEDPTLVSPPRRTPSLEVAMGPGQARAQAGSHVAFEVRVANRGAEPAQATLRVAGPAAPYAAVEPSSLELAPGGTGTATVTVAVPPGTPPQTMPVELGVMPAGATTAVTARAVLAIDAPAAPVTASAGGGSRLVPLGVGVAVIAVAVILVVVLIGNAAGGLQGRSIVSRACLHAGPDFSANPRLSDGGHCLGPANGEEVTVECSTGGTLKLSGPGDFEGRFVDADSIDVDETPPSC